VDTGKSLPPKLSKAGLKRLAVVLPNDVLGEMAMQEIMDDLKNTAASNNSDMQSKYTKDISDAIEWIKSK